MTPTVHSEEGRGLLKMKGWLDGCEWCFVVGTGLCVLPLSHLVEDIFPVAVIVYFFVGWVKLSPACVCLPCPLRSVALRAVRVSDLFTKRITVARVWEAEFRFDFWLNWWNGSEPSPPSKCAFNLSDKMHTTGLCVREVFLFGRWSEPPLFLYL